MPCTLSLTLCHVHYLLYTFSFATYFFVQTLYFKSDHCPRTRTLALNLANDRGARQQGYIVLDACLRQSAAIQARGKNLF